MRKSLKVGVLDYFPLVIDSNSKCEHQGLATLRLVSFQNKSSGTKRITVLWTKRKIEQ